jgi:hypothetical protein
MDVLTLEARGVQVTLFAPRPVSGGLEAHAFYASAALPRARTLKHQTRKYRLPALPAGFHPAQITVSEVHQ